MRYALLLAVVVLVAFARGASADGGGRAETVAFGDGRLWTTMRDRVVAVNPATGRRTAEIPTGGWGSVLAVANGTLWRLQPHSLVGVDLSSRRVRARIGLGQASYALAAARRGLDRELRFGHADEDRRPHGPPAVPDPRPTLADGRRCDPAAGSGSRASGARTPGAEA